MERDERIIEASEVCKAPTTNNKGKRKQEDNYHDNRNRRPRRAESDDEGLKYNADRREIYLDIKHKAILPNPNPMNTPIEQRNKKLWCEYHKECGHTTRNCRELKRALDKLAEEGKLNRYLKSPPKDKQSKAAKEVQETHSSADTNLSINVIAGGFASGGQSSKYKMVNSTNTKNEPLLHPPPGPKGIPFIGNLHQFDASKPHVYLAELAKTYGPIISLRFGRVSVVAVHSAKLAKEVLQTQDLNFCSRPPLVSMQRLSYNGLDMAFAPYNEYLREIRKISIVHLLSSKRVESFASIRQEEVSRVMKKISSLSSASKIVTLSELLMGFSASNICRIAFGKRYEDDEELSRRSKFHSMLNEAQAIFTSFFFSDYFPTIGWLDKLTGKFSRLEKIFKVMDAFL
uniref:Cytochrome P450 n=1 Tax=Chenopodium quinoa TaxID=63459 RepID=A0A803LKA1_CHEQI